MLHGSCLKILWTASVDVLVRCSHGMNSISYSWRWHDPSWSNCWQPLSDTWSCLGPSFQCSTTLLAYELIRQSACIWIQCSYSNTRNGDVEVCPRTFGSNSSTPSTCHSVLLQCHACSSWWQSLSRRILTRSCWNSRLSVFEAFPASGVLRSHCFARTEDHSRLHCPDRRHLFAWIRACKWTILVEWFAQGAGST